MKSELKHPTSRKVLDEVRYDCKRWRRLVTRCANTNDLIPAAMEDQYQVVHARILESFCNLASQESLPEFRRRVALQLGELLQPWSSANSLREAPAHLVHDLVSKEVTLEERLRGKRRFAMRRPTKLALVAGAAAVAGIVIVLFMQWATSGSARPLFESMSAFMASIMSYLAETTFTEQLAVAVFFSWLLATWLLSKVSAS